MKNKEYDKPVLIIKQGIRRWFNEREIFVKRNTYREINDVLIEIMKKAIRRTKLSKRRTIFPKDV